MRHATPCLQPVFARAGALLLLVAFLFGSGARASQAADGLTLRTIDAETDQLVPARAVLERADGRPQAVRRALPAGVGFVVHGSQPLPVPAGAYRFRVIRGPEYRVMSGHFSLDRDAEDSHDVPLRRMCDMKAEGWWSGDPIVTANPQQLPLLMQSEDLHFAGCLEASKPSAIPLDSGLPAAGPDVAWGPLTIRRDLAADDHGLALIGVADDFQLPDSPVSSDTIRAAARAPVQAVVVENPTAWDLPIWLASGQVDAVVVLGDWLRLDRKIKAIPQGRPPVGVGFNDALGPGRWAERVYWQMLEAGFEIAAWGASTSRLKKHPVGYCRTYAFTGEDPPEQSAWWQAAVEGKTVATNGPMLRPTLGGYPPGHQFTATAGQTLQLQVELQLTVRDPVEYLEVIHNGEVFYSAPLREFAEANGIIPKLHVKESGWVLVRIVTLHEDHFRAAISAPWYIRFDGQKRISREAVTFFQDWLSAREAELARLPADQIPRHAPYVRAARTFWANQAEAANAP